MVVPSFTDLGKSAKDVFKAGYHYGKGLFKINVRTKSGDNFQMMSDLSVNFDTPKMNGWMESKYKMKEHGTWTEKWTSDGTLFLGFDFNGLLMKEISMQTELNYNPESSATGMKFGANCANDNVNATCSISSDLNSNVNVYCSVVTAYKDFLLGYQGDYNSSTNKMTKNDVGLAFTSQDVGVHFRCTPVPHEYGFSLLYKVNPEWDAAIKGILARANNINEWTLGAAAKYKIDDNSALRFKFNTDLQLGTSLQQKLDDSVTLTLSFNVDCANITRGGHKVGLALEIEA